MSVTGAAVLLGAVVVFLVRFHAVRFTAALVCAVFGLVLAATPAGPGVQHAVTTAGAWVWSSLASL